MNIMYLMAYLILPITISSYSPGGNKFEENPVIPSEVSKKEIKTVNRGSGVTHAGLCEAFNNFQP